MEKRLPDTSEFNWPDVIAGLVLTLCFVFTRHNTNASTSPAGCKESQFYGLPFG